MEIRFNCNQLSWRIYCYFINLYFKYQPRSFICFSIMLAPVISSLDEIYCMFVKVQWESQCLFECNKKVKLFSQVNYLLVDSKTLSTAGPRHVDSCNRLPHILKIG